MSEWTQPLCIRCWPAWELAQGRTPRKPTQVVGAEPETCIACGEAATDGIYVRADPRAHEPWTGRPDA